MPPAIQSPASPGSNLNFEKADNRKLASLNGYFVSIWYFESVCWNVFRCRRHDHKFVRACTKFKLACCRAQSQFGVLCSLFMWGFASSPLLSSLLLSISASQARSHTTMQPNTYSAGILDTSLADLSAQRSNQLLINTADDTSLCEESNLRGADIDSLRVVSLHATSPSEPVDYLREWAAADETPQKSKQRTPLEKFWKGKWLPKVLKRKKNKVEMVVKGSSALYGADDYLDSFNEGELQGKMLIEGCLSHVMSAIPLCIFLIPRWTHPAIKGSNILYHVATCNYW